jgi:hypothetical protein
MLIIKKLNYYNIVKEVILPSKHIESPVFALVKSMLEKKLLTEVARCNN